MGDTTHWVRIDVAAEALHIGRERAQQIARKDKWRRIRDPRTGHYLYLIDDIRTTHRARRKDQQ